MREKWLITQPIAHRGLWNDVVLENSLLAFERAVAHGYPIELDVQMTKDGVLVVSHDWTLARMTSHAGKISRMTAQEVRTVRCGDANQVAPTLSAVLSCVDGRVPLLIEMKNRNHNRISYLVKLHDVLKNYDGRYALSSFDPFLVKKAKKIFFHVLCGQNFSSYIHRGVVQGFLRKNVCYFLWIVSHNVPDFFVCEAFLLPHSWAVRLAQKKDILLLAWGFESRDEYMKKKKCIDNYIFDNETYE